MYGSGRRITMIALLMVILGSVLVSAGEDNRNNFRGYVGVRDSECWQCHNTWDPPLREFQHILPPTGIQAGVGDVFEYPVKVQSAYLSDIRRVEAYIDVANAPSLGFVGSIPPILGEITRGTIAFDGLPTSEQTDVQAVRVDPGVTDLTITLRPGNGDPITGPDMVMRIYPAQEGTQGIPAYEIDAAGSGQPEVFQLVGSADISAFGFGNWTVEAAVTPIDTAGLDPTGLTGASYTISVDKWFNATDSTQAFLGRDTFIAPDQTGIFSWELLALGAPQPGETMTIGVNATVHYNHDSSADPDWAWIHRSIEVPVAASPTGGVSFELDDSTVVFVGPIDSGVSMSRIAEIVGYVSAFLVAASIYTGGMFGKASRRQLNKVFSSAKRRVAFHNFLSYGIILAALVHFLIFIIPGIEGNYHWTLGLIWGSLSILCMFGLGVTGAIQVPMIRRWNYAVWRWTHFGLSIGTIVFTIVHILLDGGNFGDLQSSIGWEDPLDTRDI